MDAPILTDSGGYQAYSMSDINRVDEDGVAFRSIVDGSTVTLTPERAIEVQNLLGADIIMALDDCPPSVDPRTFNMTRLRLAAQRAATAALGDGYDHGDRLDDANERTARWLERCVRAHARPDEQALFGIVQGGTDLDRRTRSAESVCSIDLPGYAIGGVAVGEGFDEIVSVVRHTAPLLAGGQAAIPDGGRLRAGHRRGGAGGGGHVRLRPADAERAQRQRLHADRPDEAPQRPVRAGRAPARRRLRLPGVPPRPSTAGRRRGGAR